MGLVQAFECAQCGKFVPGKWVEPSDKLRKTGRVARWEPISGFWRASGINEITEAYCSAECTVESCGDMGQEYLHYVQTTDSSKILRQEIQRMCDLAIHCEFHMQIDKEKGIAYMPLDEWLDWR